MNSSIHVCKGGKGVGGSLWVPVHKNYADGMRHGSSLTPLTPGVCPGTPPTGILCTPPPPPPPQYGQNSRYATEIEYSSQIQYKKMLFKFLHILKIVNQICYNNFAWMTILFKGKKTPCLWLIICASPKDNSLLDWSFIQLSSYLYSRHTWEKEMPSSTKSTPGISSLYHLYGGSCEGKTN